MPAVLTKRRSQPGDIGSQLLANRRRGSGDLRFRGIDDAIEIMLQPLHGGGTNWCPGLRL